MSYHRYHIDTAPAPNSAPHPSRFKVKVNRLELAKLLVSELIEYRGQLDLVLSRPCVYGVFSGPLGGFAPREHLCVGCLRCTVQHPQVVQIQPNPDRLRLGDSYVDSGQVNTILYEAATGRVPVRGAGYGGGFGGSGWDSMWTDMSEIVRPTRDGIHGREYISTAVELGAKPRRLRFDADGGLADGGPPTVRLPIPLLFNPPLLDDPRAAQAASQAAFRLETYCFVPWQPGADAAATSSAVAPRVRPDEVGRYLRAGAQAGLIELAEWDADAYRRLKRERTESVIGVRLPLGEPVDPLVEAGVELIHLTADYHGQSAAGFAMQAIRTVHERLIELGLREQLSLIGSGGVVAAEHLPKAIISGLDAVAIDTALLIALQGRLHGEMAHADAAPVSLPHFDPDWAVQRIVNLAASWRDQLLEVLGAMGLREVQRLRGEIGRAMFQDELEREAFGEIPGYPG